MDAPRVPEEPPSGQPGGLEAWLPRPPWLEPDPPAQHERVEPVRAVPPVEPEPEPEEERPERAERRAPAEVGFRAEPARSGGNGDVARVRPFVVTGGRTQPTYTGLKLETLLQAMPTARSASLRFEERRIIELAQRPVSLAEVAAQLAVPVGVAKVLASDLYYGNHVRLLEPHELSVDVIERIRDLVRAL
ncbi:hypothetical protein GCM10023321_76750 [Pseudonocardia eucalypti]|uniref:DUF742 domain-containing protein n=1 Tax=Pseudonocardia eucalypti TaxID=648755 RepID=A0ABP9RAA8_9PSEU